MAEQSMATSTTAGSAGLGDVVVRFAPSPTGYLHIGGARTALFNWLYAKSQAQKLAADGKTGRFLLRIEDTDRARHSDDAVEAILDGLRWLELDWDDVPVSQFTRGDRHREAVQMLLDAGAAYRCYLSTDDLAAMRAAAEAEKRPPLTVSPWRDRNPSEAPDGQSHVVRLKAPKDGVTVVNDIVQGEVTFPNKDLDDLIILRSDGSPTYNLAVVVDDHDMGITHVVRGVDHLTNAARQTQIFQLLGWDVPRWAHVPLIHGPDGAKLSKRHGALGVEHYRAMGYLPSALRNYLVRLGWSHGDDEIFSTEQAIEWFDLNGIGKSPARFDIQKLEALNAVYIREADDAELVRRCRDILGEIEGGAFFAERWSDPKTAQLEASMPGLKERAKTLVELIQSARYLFAERPLDLDKKADKLLDGDAKAMLGRLATRLADVQEWTAATIEQAVRDYAEAEDLKLGKVAQPLRAAVTGTGVSPPIFDVIEVLGRDEALARINDQAA
ncbi:MAG: glutamate--tRNA ligase [Pseudomonadota bacterium]